MRFWNREKVNTASNSDMNNTSRQYEALTPKNNITNGQEYMVALDWALSKSDIHNIAISGPYGSGKSSVIESYLKERSRLKALRISLAAFNFEKMINGDGDEIDEKQLETDILKQIFYSVDSRRISQSRYRKLQSETKWRTLLTGLLALIVLCGIIYFIVPDKIDAFTTHINALPCWKTLIVYMGFFGVTWYVLVGFVKWFRKNGNIVKIQILEKATFTNEKSREESMFNKNMDEIIYFFETTKTDLVIIEDLDRFKSTNIFVALRELNNILNHYEKIKNIVRFIYAIRDDMFEKQGERTKFFDFIIPIVPYVSSTNSEEILRNELKFDNDKNMSCIYNISGEFISLLSPFISDMRDLICICNEFNVFKNTLKKNAELNLNDEHMFALIVFKNLYPREFADMEDEKEESIVKKAFSDKRRFIEGQKKFLEEKKQIEANKIRQLEKETLQSVRELKLAWITALVDFQSAVYQIYDGRSYPISTILSDEFDVDIFKGNDLNLYIRNTNEDRRIRISKNDMKNKEDYFLRINRIKRGLANCKEESRCAIEEYEKKSNEVRIYSIYEIIKNFGIDFLSESVRNNKLLVFLLRYGYLDENYGDYINYFHPNSINKEEKNFILNVRNRDLEFDYSYSIKNAAQVFSKLQSFEFKQNEILNFDLVDYVFVEKGNTLSEKLLIEQLSNHTEKSMMFIKAYVERKKNIDKLIRHLCKSNKFFWKDLTNDDGIPLEARYKYLELLLKYADINDIVAQDIKVLIEVGNEESQYIGILTWFFENHTDVLRNIKEAPVDMQIKLIDELGIIFSNTEFETVDEEIKEEVFDNCRYELNNLMIQQLFKWKAPEQVERLKDKNYTSILKLGYPPLINYVHDYFIEYITDIVLGIETNENEEIDALEDIIERLLPKNEGLCLKVLEKEKVVWEDIKYCCKEVSKSATHSKKVVWDFLLVNDRIQCTWNNFVFYYEQYDSETCWVEYFERNIDTLLRDINNSVITEKVLFALIYADLTEENFRKYISSVKLMPYEGSLTKLNEMKIKVMIEKNLLSYSDNGWNEMDSVAPNSRVLYAVANKDKFIASLDNIEIKSEELNSFLKFEMFVPEEKRKILSKLEVTALGTETAKIIGGLNFRVDRIYLDAAWSVLEENDRYVFLLNQIDAYENEELPNLFAKLAKVYHQLIERTRHKFKFTYSDYNKRLLDKLVQKDYITSAEDEWINKEKYTESNVEKEHIITGYVKQFRT